MKLEIEIKITESRLKDLFKEMIIIVDTREKSNKHIIDYFEKQKINYSVEKLEVGDYSFKLPINELWDKEIYFTNHVVVERKSCLEELSNNFAKDRSRLENELAWMFDKGLKSYLVIENSSLEDLLLNNYQTDYNKNAFVASLLTFIDRYNLSSFFIPTYQSGYLIYNLLKYHFRNLIK